MVDSTDSGYIKIPSIILQKEKSRVSWRKTEWSEALEGPSIQK